MDNSTEKQLIDELADKWMNEKKEVIKELIIPIVNQIYFDNYLENREYVKIDLAAYDPNTDEIFFVEAENGFFLQHPQIYLPFCNHLFVLCTENKTSYREEQIQWSKNLGIGIIEKKQSGNYSIKVESVYRKIFPAVKAFVKSRIFTRLKKERKNVRKITV